MKKNLSNTDRVIRLILAGVFFMIWFEDLAVKGIVGTVLLVLAGIFAVTSFIGFCPIYGLFGLHTNAKKKTMQ
jgi:hypothetical protein